MRARVRARVRRRARAVVDPATRGDDTRVADPADRLLALLPDGAQIVVELDLARLRANPVVGAVATAALGAARR